MLIHPGVCVQYLVFEDIQDFTRAQIAHPVMPRRTGDTVLSRRTWDTVLYRLSSELHHQGLNFVWYALRAGFREEFPFPGKC